MLRYELPETFIITLLCIIPIAISFTRRKILKRPRYKKLIVSLNYSVKGGAIIYAVLIAALIIGQFWTNSTVIGILFDVVCGYSAAALFYILILLVLNIPFLPRLVRVTANMIRRQKKLKISS